MSKNDQKDKRRIIPRVDLSAKTISKRFKRVEGATVKHARRFVFKRIDSFKEARSRVAIWILAIGVLIGAAGLQFWWYQGSYTTTTGGAEGIYAEAVLGPLDTLDPIFAQSSAETSISQLLFSRLLSYDSSGHLSYDLADSMKVGKDQKTYTFTIRPDARWSDGLYVRARDVVFTVNLLKNKDTKAILTGWNGVKVKEINDLTVEFMLPDVYAPFPHALRFLPILPEHILRDVAPAKLRENVFSTKPIGSGPFVLKLLQSQDIGSVRKVVHLARNDDYYRGATKLERIQLHIYPDTDAILKALKSNEVNAASDLPISIASSINSKRYKVDINPVSGGVYALFNVTSPVLSDQSVRRALQLGTDTNKVRETLSSSAPALYLPFVSGQLFGDVPTAPKYDPNEAKRVLDEDGWKLDGVARKKDGKSLNLSVVTTKNPDFEKVLGELSRQWQQLGIAVTTTVVDPTDTTQNVARDILQPRRYDVLLYQLTIGADPDVYAYWNSTQVSDGLNFSNYKNAISDEVLSSARTRLEPALRNAKYIAFAKQWLKDVPAIGLYQSTAQYIHTDNVHSLAGDVRLNSAADRYNSVRYWTVGDKSVFKTP